MLKNKLNYVIVVDYFLKIPWSRDTLFLNLTKCHHCLEIPVCPTYHSTMVHNSPPTSLLNSQSSTTSVTQPTAHAHFPQSIGQAVQTVKKLLKGSMHGPVTALLTYRANTCHGAIYRRLNYWWGDRYGQPSLSWRSHSLHSGHTWTSSDEQMTKAIGRLRQTPRCKTSTGDPDNIEVWVTTGNSRSHGRVTCSADAPRSYL